MNCCTKENPCGYGEGDCDPNKGHCKDGLVCGSNNCAEMHKFTLAEPGKKVVIPDNMDCCYDPGIFKFIYRVRSTTTITQVAILKIFILKDIVHILNWGFYVQKEIQKIYLITIF